MNLSDLTHRTVTGRFYEPFLSVLCKAQLPSLSLFGRIITARISCRTCSANRLAMFVLPDKNSAKKFDACPVHKIFGNENGCWCENGVVLRPPSLSGRKNATTSERKNVSECAENSETKMVAGVKMASSCVFLGKRGRMGRHFLIVRH